MRHKTGLAERQEKENAVIGFNGHSFLISGETYFIQSGEVHYFRIDADKWVVHLEGLRDAGLNTVSTYIPWSLHEQEEGQIDFTGLNSPNLDLVRFINLCRELNLNLILKPGPYILAELAQHGIPRWFYRDYAEGLARDRAGQPYQFDLTSLNSPVYREKASKWYAAIMPLISGNQVEHGGPVIMMQVCNEVGLFQWLNGVGDHGPDCMSAFHDYLKGVYSEIDRLNGLYETHYKEWKDVQPVEGPVKSKADHFCLRDWHNFHRHYYKEYISHLTAEIRGYGITVPLFHNVPGWVYSRARAFPVCLSMYQEIAKEYPEIILGVDHIPENLSYRNFHDDRLANEFTRAMQGGNGPLYVAELQSGTREANVQVYPEEMLLFYKACLANGIVSMNYYMFSQGENPPGWGVYDRKFYLQTPIDVEGERSEFYGVVSEMAGHINTHGSRLGECETEAGQAILYYPPYYDREFLRPDFGTKNYENPGVIGCDLDRQFVTDDLLFDGLAKLLLMDHQEFDVVDLRRAEIEGLAKYRQVWLVCTEQLDERSQGVLVEYVRQGGHLICLPTLPGLDLDAKPCSILKGGLGVESAAVLEDSSAMISWKTGEVIHGTSRIEVFSSESGEVLARTRSSEVCGLKVSSGKGTASVLGTGFMFQAIDHLGAYQRLGLDEDFRGVRQFSNPNIITRYRKHPEVGGYMFLLNYHRRAESGRIVSDAGTYPEKGEIYLPASSGLILPVDLPLSEEFLLRRTTSEVTGIKKSADVLEMTVKGHRQTSGEMVIRSLKPIKQVLLDGVGIDFEKDNDEVGLSYEHTGEGRILKILFQ
jgi:glycosyl hydrolase family 35